jgi:hypothetical protein
VRIITTLSLVLSLTVAGLGFVAPIHVSTGHRSLVPYDIAAMVIGASRSALDAAKLRDKARTRNAIASTLSTVGILATPRTLRALDPSRDVSQSQGELGSCLVFAVALVRGPPHAA